MVDRNVSALAENNYQMLKKLLSPSSFKNKLERVFYNYKITQFDTFSGDGTILKKLKNNYFVQESEYIFIDEAHRFRNGYIWRKLGKTYVSELLAKQLPDVKKTMKKKLERVFDNYKITQFDHFLVISVQKYLLMKPSKMDFMKPRGMQTATPLNNIKKIFKTFTNYFFKRKKVNRCRIYKH